MPDSSDNYQLPSWPPTPINRELWNAVLGSVGERLTAREELEADFETLIAQGTQASLDYIQATVAPQIASLQTSIELAQEQIDQIIVDGIAPNAAKLGGQLPAYYATAASVTALNTAVGLRATTVYVDDELLELATAVQALLDQKASLTQLGLKADQSVTVSGGGLASGGGNLSANRTITVTKATDAEHQARTRDDVAATPKGVGLALAAYNKWETIEEVSLTAAGSYIKTGLSDFYELILDGTLIPSVGPVFVINVSTDNGATWITSADHIGQQTGAGGGGAANNVVTTMASIPLSWVNVQAGAELVFFGGLYAFNKPRRLRSLFEISTLNTVPQTISYRVDGWGSPAAPGLVARNAFRILPSGGNISGQFTLFGKRG